MEDTSVAKLVENDVGSLDYSSHSRALEEGTTDDTDWGTREGSLK